MNETKIFNSVNVAVRITKDDQKKEFLIEGGYANRDDLFKPILVYPFAGWETWEEIEPVAIGHLKMILEHSHMKRKYLAASFDKAVVSAEEAWHHAEAMTESLKISGRYLKVPKKT